MSNPAALRRMAGFATLTAGLMTAAAALSAHAETTPAPTPQLIQARERLAEAWTQAPLAFDVATFTQDKARGYGRYTPRADAVFAPDAPIHVYAEPVAFGYGRTGDRYSVSLTASFELRNTTGQILAKGDDFARLNQETRHRVREFPAILSYRFDGLAPGDYVLVTRLDDANSDKSGTFSLPFSVVTP